MNASRSARKARLAAGALWIGGADNFVIEILGNGHKPGLKAVRNQEKSRRLGNATCGQAAAKQR